jgi:carbon monoxide dehydrogenase subunit G
VSLAEGENAMGEFTISIFINRSPEDVFDFLSNPANLSKWNSSFESAEWASSGAPGAGSTYRAVGKLLGSRKEGFFEIVEWEHPHRYSYRGRQRMFPIARMETVITLDPKDGGAQVTFDAHFELVGMLQFTEGLLGMLGKKQDGDNLVAAKRLLETG